MQQLAGLVSLVRCSPEHQFELKGQARKFYTSSIIDQCEMQNV